MSNLAINQRPFVVPPEGIRIGRFILDRRRSGLSCGDEFWRLRPQVFALLEVLAVGGVLSREQLAQAIWGADVDTALLGNPLDQIISDVRRSLTAIPELALRREAKGYRLDAEEPVESPERLESGQVLPVGWLKDPARWLGGCDLARKRFLYVVSQPLELDEGFARATLSHLEAGAKVHMVLPESRHRSCAKLLAALICHELPGGEDRRSTGIRRIETVILNLRVSLVADHELDLPHMQFYRYDEERDAVAMVLSQTAQHVFVHSIGLAALSLAKKQERLMITSHGDLPIGIGSAQQARIRNELEFAIREDFRGSDEGLSAVLVRQLWSAS